MSFGQRFPRMPHAALVAPGASRPRPALHVAMFVALSLVWTERAAAENPAADKASAKPTLAETTVRPAIEKARTLREEGKHEEALDALRVATREVKQAEGETAPNLLPIYELAADILVETAQTEKATALLEKAIELHRTLLAESRHPDPACYGRTLLVEHRHHAAERKIEPALDTAKRAWLLLDVHAGPSADDTQRAAEAFAKSLATFHELLGPDHDATLAATPEPYEDLEHWDTGIELARQWQQQLPALRVQAARARARLEDIRAASSLPQ